MAFSAVLAQRTTERSGRNAEDAVPDQRDDGERQDGDAHARVLEDTGDHEELENDADRVHDEEEVGVELSDEGLLVESARTPGGDRVGRRVGHGAAEDVLPRRVHPVEHEHQERDQEEVAAPEHEKERAGPGREPSVVRGGTCRSRRRGRRRDRGGGLGDRTGSAARRPGLQEPLQIGDFELPRIEANFLRRGRQRRRRDVARARRFGAPPLPPIHRVRDGEAAHEDRRRHEEELVDAERRDEAAREAEPTTAPAEAPKATIGKSRFPSSVV